MNKNRVVLSITFFLLLSFTASIDASTSLTYVYDANGNLISGDGKYYEYNDANQLIRVKYGDANGTVIAEYFYDYTGQRIKKIENGVTTYYIGKYFEKQVDSAGSATNTSYYFANGERVAKKDAFGNISYYHSDHLGGTNVITNSSGNLVERIKYYPFGEIREGGNEKYQFTGKEKDKLTDYYYFEARYYDSEIKHFTQADTVAPNIYDPQDLNRYAYVRNNPLKFIDPTGHKAVWWKPWTWFERDGAKESQNGESQQSKINNSSESKRIESGSAKSSNENFDPQKDRQEVKERDEKLYGKDIPQYFIKKFITILVKPFLPNKIQTTIEFVDTGKTAKDMNKNRKQSDLLIDQAKKRSEYYMEHPWELVDEKGFSRGRGLSGPATADADVIIFDTLKDAIP